MLIPHKEGDLLHNRVIPHGHGKFLLKTVFIRRALAWNNFDQDIHCEGAYLSWNMKDLQKYKTRYFISVTIAGEAKDASGVKEVPAGRGRKRIRDEMNSKAARCKQQHDRGESYSP